MDKLRSKNLVFFKKLDDFFNESERTELHASSKDTPTPEAIYRGVLETTKASNPTEFSWELRNTLYGKMKLEKFDSLTHILESANFETTFSQSELTINANTRFTNTENLKASIQEVFDHPLLRERKHHFKLFLLHHIHTRLGEVLKYDEGYQTFLETEKALGFILRFAPESKGMDNHNGIQVVTIKTENSPSLTEDGKRTLQNIFLKKLSDESNNKPALLISQTYSRLLVDLTKEATNLEEKGEVTLSDGIQSLCRSLNQNHDTLISKKSNYHKFRTQSLADINTFQKTYGNRVEIQQVLANIGLCILGLGIFYAAAVLVNKAATGEYLFFKPHREIQKTVDNLKSELEIDVPAQLNKLTFEQ